MTQPITPPDAPVSPALKTAALVLLLAASLALSSRANISAGYGVIVTPQGKRIDYITQLPIGTRPILNNGRTYYLANGIYYQAVMYRGRTVYIAVDETWQAQQQGR